MKATEKLTYDQANNLVKQHVKKAVQDRVNETGEVDYFTKLSIESAIYQTMFELLLHKDPTEVATQLFLVDRRYLITKFETPNDKEGIVLHSFTSESVCDWYLQHYENTEPEFTFTKSIKLTEK